MELSNAWRQSGGLVMVCFNWKFSVMQRSQGQASVRRGVRVEDTEATAQQVFTCIAFICFICVCVMFYCSTFHNFVCNYSADYSAKTGGVLWSFCLSFCLWVRPNMVGVGKWCGSRISFCSAVHKRGICRHTVSVCLFASVRVCLSRSWIVWKRINLSSKFFHHRVAKPF